MPFSLKTHIVKKVDGEGIKIVRTQPYMRLNAQGGPVIYVQNGAFYSEGGQSIKRADLPDWFDAELAKVDPGIRSECGLDK
jgi:hypothetical protein